MAMMDLEKGLGESSERPTRPQDGPQSLRSPDLTNNISRNKPLNELQTFQTLVGIHFLTYGGGPLPESELQPKPASPLLDIFRPSKAGTNRFRNRGLYDRALSHDLKYRVLYTMSSYIISGLYLLQITLAATFTALSAYQASLHIVLTVLGACNTVVAGMLAWLTGQGMPIRFRRARDRYREVVKAIETAERMFAQIDEVVWPDGERPNPVVERDRLDRLFEEARMDQEANYPEVHYDPSSIQTSQMNDHLRDRASDLKRRKDQHASELEMMREELNELKRNATTSSAHTRGTRSSSRA